MQFSNKKTSQPKFSKIGFRRFQDLQAGEKLSAWSRSAFSDTLFRSLLLLWFFPITIATIYTAYILKNLPDQVPLFYSRTWGESQLAAKAYLFIPLVGSFLLGIFNFGVAINYHAKDRVSSYLMAGAAALISILASITIFSIIYLIGT